MYLCIGHHNNTINISAGHASCYCCSLFAPPLDVLVLLLDGLASEILAGREMLLVDLALNFGWICCWPNAAGEFWWWLGQEERKQLPNSRQTLVSCAPFKSSNFHTIKLENPPLAFLPRWISWSHWKGIFGRKFRQWSNFDWSSTEHSSRKFCQFELKEEVKAIKAWSSSWLTGPSNANWLCPPSTTLTHSIPLAIPPVIGRVFHWIVE
jgi:hypothetical protein